VTDRLEILPVQGSLLEEVVFVDHLLQKDHGLYSSVSETGHLIHLTKKGRREERSSGFSLSCGKGDSVWYYENEMIEGRITEAPIEFYTINFKAPALPAPLPEHRVRQVKAATFDKAERLLQTWRATGLPATERHLRLHALLLDLVLDILSEPALQQRVDTPARLWWRMENMLRLDLSQPCNMSRIVQLAGCSERSVIRSCHHATGLPPMKRMKHLRLAYARSLVQHSDFPITEVASSVGYERVHELSRDYRKHFGIAPTFDRKRGPDYPSVKSHLFLSETT